MVSSGPSGAGPIDVLPARRDAGTAGALLSAHAGDDPANGDATRSGADGADATDVAPTRVRRPPSAAASWYGRLGRWYDRVAGPFEAPAREAGLSLLDARPGERVVDVRSGPGGAGGAGPVGRAPGARRRRGPRGGHVPGEARDLAGPLPMEIDRFLPAAEADRRFDFGEFVPAGEMRQVRDQLRADFDTLFEHTELATA